MDAVDLGPDDGELWTRSLRGDGRAFAGLFDRHRARVFRSVLRLVETTHEAEDVVATTFLELWRLRDRVRIVDGSVLPWLLVTALNVARNAARSRRRYERVLASIPVVHDNEELDRIEALHSERATMAALRSLPAADAAILVLVGFEGLTLSESAQVLGITVEAAKQRLSRARRRARERVGHPNTTEHLAAALQTMTGRSTP